MKKDQKYIIKFINAKNEEGTVWYSIQVFSPKDDESWTFRQRYSQMREKHERCTFTNKKNDLPQFPHKKLFGNTDQGFIQKRKKMLENYYNTLLASVDIQELPQLLEFFNTNKPVKKKAAPTSIDKEKETKNEKTKQLQVKKKLEEIAKKAEQKLVECQDFNHDIDDHTRTTYNQEFQKMKLDLKSSLLDGEFKIKGSNDTEDYWAFTIKDNHQQAFNRTQAMCGMIVEKVNSSIQCKNHEINNFVVVL